MFIVKEFGIIGESGQIKGYGDKLRQISEFTMYACRARTTYSGTAAATIHAVQVMYTYAERHINFCTCTQQDFNNLLVFFSSDLLEITHWLPTGSTPWMPTLCL